MICMGNPSHVKMDYYDKHNQSFVSRSTLSLLNYNKGGGYDGLPQTSALSYALTCEKHASILRTWGSKQWPCQTYELLINLLRADQLNSFTVDISSIHGEAHIILSSRGVRCSNGVVLYAVPGSVTLTHCRVPPGFPDDTPLYTPTWNHSKGANMQCLRNESFQS